MYMYMLFITETLENGLSINELMSHGVDLLTALLPQSSPVEEVRCVYMYQYEGQI